MILQKRLADKRLDPIAYAIAVQFLSAVILAVVLGFTGFDFGGMLRFWPNLILMVLLWSGFNALNLFALKKVEASHFIILFQTRVFWTLLVSLLIMNAKFTALNLAGLVLITVAVIIATPKANFGTLNRNDFYVFLAAMFFGLGIANDVVVLKGVASPITYSFLTLILPAIFLAVAFPKALKKFGFLTDKKVAVEFYVTTALAALTLMATYTSFKIGNPAIITSISQIGSVVVVLLSIVFLRERDRIPLKIFAALVSFFGLLLLV